MDPIPADQKLITEHPELVDPISGVIPPVPQAPASATAEPDQDSTLPTEEELEEPQDAPVEAAGEPQEADRAPQARKAHPATRPRQQAQERQERVRRAIPKGARRAKKR
jgi:hypothetical protein